MSIDSVFLWNPETGTGLMRLPSAPAANTYQAQWSPLMPSVYATGASTDGKLNLYSLNNTGQSRQVPKWLHRAAGVSFAFGGKLVSFASGEELKAPPTPNAAAAGSLAAVPTVATGKNTKVNLQQLVTEPQLLTLSTKFQTALKGGDYAAFCQAKLAEVRNETDRETWTYLQILLTEDPVARRDALIKELGFEVPKAGAAALQPNGTEGKTADAKAASATPAPAPAPTPVKASIPLPDEPDSESFFDKVQPIDQPPATPATRMYFYWLLLSRQLADLTSD